MSVDLNVFLKRSQLPAPTDWSNAILEMGFEAQLDTDFDLENFTGFLPCKYKRVESGFEYYSDEIAEVDQAESGGDYNITFTTGSDLREAITSLIAAGVLAKMCEGTLYDPQSGESYPASAAIDWVRNEEAECEKDL